MCVANCQTVLLPIVVPVGRYCWDFHQRLCGHYDNEGGYSSCDLNLGTLMRTSDGILKPDKCLGLDKTND